jgi:hypothetical protein
MGMTVADWMGSSCLPAFLFGGGLLPDSRQRFGSRFQIFDISLLGGLLSLNPAAFRESIVTVSFSSRTSIRLRPSSVW